MVFHELENKLLYGFPHFHGKTAFLSKGEASLH